jgi:Protein of unknown function (DUF2771)
VSRRLAAVALVVVLVSAVGIGLTVWLVVRHHPPQRPEISAYSNGHLTRVGPYRYCNVLNLGDCQEPQAQGQLPVNGRDPVQLSVPTAIGAAPWRLLRVYEDPRNTTVTVFRPNTRLAVTIGTVDPARGRLTGVVVQLLTLVVNRKGEFTDAPHAEWSVRMVWH